MNRITIDVSFLKLFASDIDVFLNILLRFVQDNPYKICLDSDGKGVEIYCNLARENDNVMLWWKFMEKNNFSCIDRIILKDAKNCNAENLFLYIASEAYPCRRLLVSSKNILHSLHATLIESRSITLIDKDEARNLLNQSVTIYQSSMGDHSPNIIGNSNNIK